MNVINKFNIHNVWCVYKQLGRVKDGVIAGTGADLGALWTCTPGKVRMTKNLINFTLLMLRYILHTAIIRAYDRCTDGFPSDLSYILVIT